MLRNKRGFSLLELIIVVVIIGITIAGATVMMRGETHRKASVKSAARDVASLMRLAHSKALSERIYYNLVIDLSNENCYLERMYRGTTYPVYEDIPATTSIDESGDNTTVTDNSPGASKRMPKVVDIDNVNGTNSGEVRITFTLKETVVKCDDPYNTPDPYSVFLDDDKDGEGNVKYLVTVDPDTARVKIYDTWTP